MRPRGSASRSRTQIRFLLPRLASALGWQEHGQWSTRLVENGFAIHVPGSIELTVAGTLFLLPDASLPLGKVYVEILRYQLGSDAYDKRQEILVASTIEN